MTRGPREELLRVLGPLADDALSLSDAEILDEVRAEGGDPVEMLREVANVFERALQVDGLRRLAAARTQLDSVRSLGVAGAVALLPLAAKQRIVGRFAENEGTFQERLTMAARGGDGASEREIDSILSDLVELGAIDEKGNLR